MSWTSFSSTRKKRISIAREMMDSKANDIASVSKIVKYKLREIERLAVLARDKNVMFQEVVS